MHETLACWITCCRQEHYHAEGKREGVGVRGEQEKELSISSVFKYGGGSKQQQTQKSCACCDNQPADRNISMYPVRLFPLNIDDIPPCQVIFHSIIITGCSSLLRLAAAFVVVDSITTATTTSAAAAKTAECRAFPQAPNTCICHSPATKRYRVAILSAPPAASVDSVVAGALNACLGASPHNVVEASRYLTRARTGGEESVSNRRQGSIYK